MAFKPWSEQRAPRHLLEDTDEDFSAPQSLPTIAITNPEALHALSQTLIVIPDTLRFLPETLDKIFKGKKTVAELIIKKKFTRRIDPDEFIEEEQLYSADAYDGETHEEVISTKCAIFQYTDSLSILTVKNYENSDKINYNLIASELLNHTPNLTLVTITPGTLPYGQQIATLGPNWETNDKYPVLVPPFVVTGIAGALATEAVIQGKVLSTFVLQSEGVTGFEKVNEFAIDEVGALLEEKFSFGKDFVKTLRIALRSGKSVNNFGLYL